MKKFIYTLALKVIFRTIDARKTKLTPEYLLAKGWIEEDGVYFDPYMKEKCTIYIRFGMYTYELRYGKEKTFIDNSKSLEWFELFYMMVHRDNRAWLLK